MVRSAAEPERTAPCSLLTRKLARPTILKFCHLLSVIRAINKLEQFSSGETVYARFFGSETFVVKEIAKTDSSFPHYLCQSRDGIYLIPMIHLSRRDLLPLVGDGNRQQLELPLALRETEGPS